MQVATTIRLLLTFYKNFSVASLLVTLICCLLYVEFGNGILPLLYLLKLSTMGLVFLFIRARKKKEFYYYHNLGLTKTYLWSGAFFFDLILYVLFLISIMTLALHHFTANSIRLTLGSRPILTDVNLHCKTGAITGLLGKNGAGKSYLLQILYGTATATTASVKFDGRQVIKPYRQPHLIRFLPQFNFIPRTNTLQRVLDDFQLEYTELEKRFPEFKNTCHRMIGQFSQGERRLIELYAIICSISQFALLDEPFTHLMPLQIEKVRSLLIEFRAQKGFLITDHLWQSVVSISDTVYLLNNGIAHPIDGPVSQQHLETLGYLPSRRN